MVTDTNNITLKAYHDNKNMKTLKYVYGSAVFFNIIRVSEESSNYRLKILFSSFTFFNSF